MALENYKKLKKSKKEAILNAIANCLKVHDYDELSINDITKEAQIARGSFYNYFKDKGDAVYTLLIDRLISVTQILKDNIIDNNCDLFIGCERTYERIKNYIKNEIDASFYKNIKYIFDLSIKIFYTNEFDNELEMGLDWLLENTKEGRTVLSNRKNMANTFSLITTLVFSSISEMIATDNGINIKYNDFSTKLNIIRLGVYNINKE